VPVLVFSLLDEANAYTADSTSHGSNCWWILNMVLTQCARTGHVRGKMQKSDSSRQG